MAAAMVIAGAGEAGARAAVTLREEGYDGPIALIGEEPHAPYERPPLSKAMLSAQEAVASPPVILDAVRMASLGIEHRPGVRVRRLDTNARTAHLSNGDALRYDRLLIATGASPRRLAVPGGEEAGVFYLRTFADAEALRARLRPGCRLAVIGGGFIGLELAAGAVQRGCRVTLVEAGARLLTRGVPEPVAAVLKERHERAGVDMRLGAGVERIERRGAEAVVILAEGEGIVCDLVVAGIGAVPETALAAASGLAVDNGVRVDGTLRTSDPHVFAAGDCCAFPHPLYGGRSLRLEAWRNAQEQGAHAARSMLGARAAYDAVPWFWSDQYDLGLQVAGLSDEGATTVVRRDADTVLCFHLAADGRLVGASGVGPGNAVARDIKLAEMMIASALAPVPALLADAGTKLKSLLRPAPAAA